MTNLVLNRSMSLRFCHILYTESVYSEGGLFRFVCLEIKEYVVHGNSWYHV
jgi:hypothetical protein